jgi:exosome complex exonuclease RRP6
LTFLISFSHPYEYELDMFNPPEHQLTKVEPKLPRTEHIPLKFVDSLEDLNAMVKQLKNVTELAVDLEVSEPMNNFDSID